MTNICYQQKITENLQIKNVEGKKMKNEASSYTITRDYSTVFFIVM